MPGASDREGTHTIEGISRDGLDGDPLVVDESSRLVPEETCRVPAPEERAAGWRKAKAFEVHAALRELRAASHIIDVCLARLLRLMNGSGPGFRRWGCKNFDQYLTQELRQPSARRFRYMVSIDEAIVTRPLVKLGDAWKRGRVSVSQARELIRVMTPDNEQEWLERAGLMSVKELQGAVQRELASTGRDGAAGVARDEVRADEAWDRRAFAGTRPVDDAWQVCVETSRRMAGYEMPLADCVDDLLAEYAAACPEVLADIPVEELARDAEEVAAGPNDHPDAQEILRRLWRQSVTQTVEARRDLEKLRQAARAAQLAVNPLEGLVETGQADPDDLHRRIRWVLRVGQNIAWHECRLVRLMAGLALFESLGATSMESYATMMVGYSVRTLRATLALARTLERFPKIAAAFRCGWITGAEALSIGKAARPGTQGDWITRAASSTLQGLKADVAFSLQAEDVLGLPPGRPLPDAGNGVRPCARPPAGRTWAGQPEPDPEDDCMRVRRCAPRTTQNIPTSPLRRVEGVDGWYAAFCSDRSGVTRAMLSAGGPHRPITFHAPEEICRWWDLTLAHCRRGASEQTVPTDSQCVALVLLNFLDEWVRPEVIKSSRRYRTFTRDGWRCQVPGCGSRAHLHAHHVIYRSRNGPDEGWNLVSVCRSCHEMIHSGCISVRGRAPRQLEWAMGVNAAGDVRERFRNGLRVACDPAWKTATSNAAPRTVAPDDWRQSCDAVA